MKKVLAMVLALAMVFALCACGNGGNNGGDSATYDKITLLWQSTAPILRLTAA